MGYYKDQTGKKYGKLTVLEYVDLTPNHKSLWRCQCECGETTVVRSDKLSAGRITHCGCERKYGGGRKRGSESTNSARSRVLRDYRQRARKHGLAWDLTNEAFDELTSSPCHYCGIEPSNIRSYRGYVFVYNGIDRIDNNLGYLPHNVVSCCSQCNTAKWSMDYDEFCDWIQRLAKHLILK